MVKNFFTYLGGPLRRLLEYAFFGASLAGWIGEILGKVLPADFKEGLAYGWLPLSS